MKNGIAKRGSSYSYVIRVPDPKTGKTKPKWISGFRTEQEAKRARDKARVDVSHGQYVNPSKIQLGDFLTEWIKIHSATLKARTAEGYGDLISRYIIPRLGRMQLAQIRPSHLQNFYKEIYESGGQGGRPLSARTVQYVAAILKKSLRYAVEIEGLIPNNPATRVSLPKGTSKRLEPFTPSQMKIFQGEIQKHRLYPLFRLAIYSGARKGELLALGWEDIDFENARIVISKNRVVVNGKHLIQESTKGGEGRRSVHLDSETMKILSDHRKRQIGERLKAGKEWRETGFVFVTEFGSPLDYGTPTQLFSKTIKRLGLPEQRFHDLRHFHATQLLRAGTPLHVVAQRLGHRDPMVTATTYAHVTADQAENASEIFARAIS